MSISLTTQTGLEVKLENGVLSVHSAGFEQSIVHVNDLQLLEFEYLQQMTLVLDCLIPSPQPVRVFHAGCGAGALAGAWASKRPGSRQVAVDIDAELVNFARKYAGLPPKPAVSFRSGEARGILTESVSATGTPTLFNVIVRDAFADELVPHSLQTVQWNQLVQTHLTTVTSPTVSEQKSSERQPFSPASFGWYFANVAHSPSVSAKSEIASISAVFDTVFLVADPKVLKSARKGNLVAVATNYPANLVDFTEIDRALRSLALTTRLIYPSDLAKWLAGAKPLFD